ncbi:hypothetical protein R5R35_003101 [Gryllus longicercus]|uniref:DnaJ homolog subfamily C member 10 n=1 Tax=Gryllus longicercus TaxID=2509291 RepID=A0AAN9Z6G2_9ORTH
MFECVRTGAFGVKKHLCTMFTFKHWLIFIVLLVSICSGEDYYELLGVAKSANNREIRKAFKKLAVKLHPDKNKNDPNAQSVFIQLTKAYETLKDEELRKKYDLYGEEGIKENKHQNYHSWSYYQDNFGIYDDDPEIITLSRADFEQSVVNSPALWFINFYSGACSHCHRVAPAWRRLARAVQGVVRVGAVNCEEDWVLCRREGVHSYPSLIMYPARERYNGERTAEAMESHVLKMLHIPVLPVTFDSWKSQIKLKEMTFYKPWALFLCYDDEECAEEVVRLKVAAILEGLVNVGVVDCMKEMKLCTHIGGDANVVFWEDSGLNDEGTIHKITNTDFKDIAHQILSFLPEAKALNSQQFEEMKAQLLLDSKLSWLVYFYLGGASDEDLELKKLPALLSSNMRIGKVHCGQEVKLCQQMHINRYPVFAVFKPGGGYELYHGRESAHDIANFAEESRSALNMGVLTPETFQQFVIDSRDSATQPWLIDFYAPWCPPCMRLLPEFRKASHHFASQVKFGSVDCTVHASLCRQYNIRSYPTTILYNNSVSHQFYGGHTSDDLVEFVDSFLHPVVIKLTEDNFYETVGEKPAEEIWMVDFFAPWCGPCQQLSPHWKKLAKSVAHLSKVHLGEVDCQAETRLCDQQGIRSYPTIRLYPTGSKGLSSFAIYSGYQRDGRTLRQWLYNFLPTTVEEITPTEFQNKIYGSKDMWLLDFYAPWCGHCAAFLPEFQEVSQKLEGKIRTGKVNCDSYIQLCQKAGVRAYPTVVLYKPHNPPSYIGEEIESQSSAFIISYVEKVLSQKHSFHPHDEF